MKGNVLVGQSGGPTAVINSSLAGVFKTAKERGYGRVYGMRFGIQGFLDEQYVDLSDYIRNELELELLKRTPSAFLGTRTRRSTSASLNCSTSLTLKYSFTSAETIRWTPYANFRTTHS